MYLVSCSKAKHLTHNLATGLSAEVVNFTTQVFPGNEFCVTVANPLSANKRVVVVQNLISVNDDFMELAITLDALKRANGGTVTVVIPYFGYSRQDKMSAQYSSIAFKVIANLLSCIQIDRLFTVDLHSLETIDFFSFPVINISTTNLFAEEIRLNHSLEDVILISPDFGGINRVKDLAQLLNVPYTFFFKQREHEQINMKLCGNVSGKKCIIIDDIIATGHTIESASKILLAEGASSVSAYCSHLLNIVDTENFKDLSKICSTNSITHSSVPTKTLDITSVLCKRLISTS